MQAEEAMTPIPGRVSGGCRRHKRRSKEVWCRLLPYTARVIAPICTTYLPLNQRYLRPDSYALLIIPLWLLFGSLVVGSAPTFVASRIGDTTYVYGSSFHFVSRFHTYGVADIWRRGSCVRGAGSGKLSLYPHLISTLPPLCSAAVKV